MRRKIALSTIVTAAALAALLLIYQPIPGPVEAPSDTVAVSWGLLAEIVYRLGGGEIHVYQLLPPGVEIHDWEPTAEALKIARSSKLVIWTVEGFDGWAADLAEKSVKSAEGIELLRLDHGYDTHLWLSPLNMVKMVQNIAEALGEAFPEKRAMIQQNAEKLISELMDLHKEIENALKRYRGSLFITQHDSFRYFANTYGLRYLAVLGPEEEEPSAIYLAQLYNIIKSEGLKFIYAEDGFIHPVIRSIADELGLTIRMLYTGEGLTLEEVKKGRSYIELMRLNVKTLVEGFEKH